MAHCSSEPPLRRPHQLSRLGLLVEVPVEVAELVHVQFVPPTEVPQSPCRFIHLCQGPGGGGSNTKALEEKLSGGAFNHLDVRAVTRRETQRIHCLAAEYHVDRRYCPVRSHAARF